MYTLGRACILYMTHSRTYLSPIQSVGLRLRRLELWSMSFECPGRPAGGETAEMLTLCTTAFFDKEAALEMPR